MTLCNQNRVDCARTKDALAGCQEFSLSCPFSSNSLRVLQQIYNSSCIEENAGELTSV